MINCLWAWFIVAGHHNSRGFFHGFYNFFFNFIFTNPGEVFFFNIKFIIWFSRFCWNSILFIKIIPRSCAYFVKYFFIRSKTYKNSWISLSFFWGLKNGFGLCKANLFCTIFINYSFPIFKFSNFFNFLSVCYTL